MEGLIFNKVEIDKIHSRNFKVIMGPLVCIFVSPLVGYIIFLVNAAEGDSFFGWRFYVFGAIGLIVGVLVQKNRLPIGLLYISGVPYDGAHDFVTAFFLFLFGENVIRKVERAKIKYGMYR